MMVAKGMRQSRTLVAVHLSGNNMGDDSKLEILNELTKSSTDDTFELDSNYGNLVPGKVTESKVMKLTKLILTAQMQKKMNRFSVEQRSTGVNETIDDRIIFTRILGHIEIKDSHIWKLNTRCWV